MRGKHKANHLEYKLIVFNIFVAKICFIKYFLKRLHASVCSLIMPDHSYVFNVRLPKPSSPQHLLPAPLCCRCDHSPQLLLTPPARPSLL